MPIKTIIFDLGNTVINFDHRIAVKRIEPLCDKTFDEILDLFFDSDITERFETGKISSRAFYLEVKSLIGLKMSYEEFLPIWNEIFFKSPEPERIVRKLKGKYRLILLSNINALHMGYIKEKFDIIEQFDEIVASCEVGFRKPHKEIYEAALQKAHCAKEELIYTDDRRDLIKASTALGIPSVQFTGAKQLIKDFEEIGINLDGEK